MARRSYSRQEDGIRVKQFTDRLEVESPGRLPELVRVQNIRKSRFSRNPHIARVLAELTDYVREMNEGVERMFQEMEQVGLRPPIYEVTPAGVRVTLYKLPSQSQGLDSEVVSNRIASLRKRIGEPRLALLLETLRSWQQAFTHEIAIAIGVFNLTARNYMKQLEEVALVTRNKEAPNDPTARWVISEAPFWRSDHA